MAVTWPLRLVEGEQIPAIQRIGTEAKNEALAAALRPPCDRPVIHVQFVAGTEAENAPDQPPELRLGRTLSYDEMALSALLSVRAVTCPLHVRYMGVTCPLHVRYDEMALSALLSVRAVTCPFHVRYMGVTWLLRSRYMGVTDVSDVQALSNRPCVPR